MRIGIITDIHSNIVALDAVLSELGKRKVDKISFKQLKIIYEVDKVVKEIKK